MNGKLVSRIEKLEASHGVDRPLRYVWLAEGDRVETALDRARQVWPHARLIPIGWQFHAA